MERPDKRNLALLLILYCLTRLPPMLAIPLIQDESLYSIMMEEQLRAPTLIPTFLGHPVSWKPFLFFWAYAPAALWPEVSEAAYRFPSFLFGLGTVVLTYLLLKNSGMSRNIAALSTLLFTFSFLTIYPHSMLLTDSMAFFFITASLYLYSEGSLPRGRFLAAGLCAFIAFFVKLVIAFMAPLLALAFFFAFRREILRDRLFLLSLLATPLAFALHFLLLDSAGLAGELYGGDIGGHVLSGKGVLGQIEFLSGSIITLMITGSILWISISAYGFLKYWRGNLFMTAWYLLILVPFFTSGFMPWYYLPVMPAVGYFAALPLLMWKGKEKPDAAFRVFLCFLLIVSAAVLIFDYTVYYKPYYDHREAGTLLSGKEDVLIIGEYVPAVVAYKVLGEYKSRGAPLDFGWITFHYEATRQDATPFLEDYHYDGVPVVDGSFSPFFTKTAIYRKDTDIASFKYIALLEVQNVTLPYKVLYNKSNITIYEVG